MKLFFVLTKVLFLAAMCCASDVSIVADPRSSSISDQENNLVSFYNFKSRPCPGTVVDFKRYSVPEADLPPANRIYELSKNTTFFECADLVALGGGDAFMFSDGVCRELIPPSNLVCQFDGEAVYVAQRAPARSSELIEEISDGVYKTRILFPLYKTPRSVKRTVPLTCEDPVIEDNEFAIAQKGEYAIYNLGSYDFTKCAVPEDTDSTTRVVYFNPPESDTSTEKPLYLIDYCGGSVPVVLEGAKSIYSHRGYWCGVFPDDEVLDGCTVNFWMRDDYDFPTVRNLDSFVGNDACGGLNITYSLITQDGEVTADFCDRENPIDRQGLRGYNHTLRFVGNGKPTRPKFGFEFYNDT